MGLYLVGGGDLKVGFYGILGWGCATQVFNSWSYFKPENVIFYPISNQTAEVDALFQTRCSVKRPVKMQLVQNP